MYQGADAMLFWLPHDWGSFDSERSFHSIRVSLASLFAFAAGIPLSRIIERATHDAHAVKVAKLRIDALDELLNASADASSLERLAKKYEDKQQETPWTQSAVLNRELAERARALAERLRSNEERERQHAVQRQDEQLEAAKRSAESSQQIVGERIRLANLLRTTHPRCSDLEDIEDGVEYLLDGPKVRRLWADLERLTGEHFQLCDKEIDAGSSDRRDITALFHADPGVSVKSGFAIFAQYTGDHNGGRTAFVGESERNEFHYLNALTFPKTLHGAVSALYFAYRLHTIGAFWHGLYGRDYKFLLNSTELIEALIKLKLSNEELAKLNRPAGIRFSKSNGECRITCLAVYPNGTIVDISVDLDQGAAILIPQETVFESRTKFFY
jgi:hypothetical protein